MVPHWMQAQFPSAPVPRWMLSTVRLAGPGLVQQPQARLGLGLLDWSLQATNNAGLSPETSTSQISSAQDHSPSTSSTFTSSSWNRLALYTDLKHP